MLLDLNPYPPLRGKFEWPSLCCGIAGIFIFGVLPEHFPDFDAVVPRFAIVVVLLVWITCSRKTVGFYRPLLRATPGLVLLGRTALMSGVVRLGLARTLEDLSLAVLLLLAIYLVAWATLGPASLFTRTGWRIISSPRKWHENLQALIAGELLPIRTPTITRSQWISHTYGICSEIDRWTDWYALRLAVIETLQFRECLAF